MSEEDGGDDVRVTKVDIWLDSVWEVDDYACQYLQLDLDPEVQP